ncbi:MAG TPA: TIGR03016 family PEP-CTERM system-associated outer membrane protein [Rhizomicrobium sp.]|jgi:uncharacterized protein (PEP-CTERM system associated)
MQLLGVSRTGRAGKVAGGCALLLALGVPYSASAQVNGRGLDVGNMLSAGAFATKGEVETRELAVTPLVGLQETFTDNAFLTSTNKEYDFITRPMAGVQVVSQGGPAVGTLLAHVYYDAYARASSLSGVSGDAQANGSYTLVPAFLTIDANGFLTNTYTSSFGVAAEDRAGLANRVQVASYSIGPRMTTTIGDFADFTAFGHFSQIFFDDPNGSSALVPSDSTIEQGAASLDTDSRFKGFQFVTALQYVRDDHMFESYGALQTAYVNITEDLRVIARGGYDAATDPGIVDIHAPIWSAGLEYQINPLSKISVERGERFNHAAWTANLHLQLSDKIYADGRYTELLQPSQIQIGGSFDQFLTEAGTLPQPLAPGTFGINNNLNNQVSLNKLADLHLVYQFENDTIDFGAYWNDQMFLALNRRGQSVIGTLDYSRVIAEDLSASVGGSYWRTLSNPLFPASEFYAGRLSLQYDLNPTMRAYAGYSYSHQALLGLTGTSVSENLLYAAITKRF